MNVPVCLVALALTLRVARPVPDARPAPASARPDLAGTGLFAVLATGMTLGLMGASAGWSSPRTWAPLVVAVAALIAFLLVERRTDRPLVDLRWFRRPAVAAAMAGAAIFSVPFAVLVFTSLWLQDALGLTPSATGLALVPLAAATAVTSTISGRLDRAPGRVLAIGLLVTAAGLGLQALLVAPTGPLTLVPGLVLTGIGAGLAGPAVGRAVAGAAPPEGAGSAAGLMSTLRQVGQTLGVAVLTVVYAPAVPTDGLRRVAVLGAVLAASAGLTALAAGQRSDG